MATRSGSRAQWAIKGATNVNGQSVSGYNWSVNAANQSSFSVAGTAARVRTDSGSPGGATSGAGGVVCGSNNQEQVGVDGVYIYLQYQLVVTAREPSHSPVLPAIGAVANNPCNGTPDLMAHASLRQRSTRNATTAPGISFTAVDASSPTATLSTPTQGALYAFGQSVNAAYSCSEPTGGVTITSCTGVEDAGTAYQQSVANGAALNTSDLVPNQIHTFTVTATNSEGYIEYLELDLHHPGQPAGLDQPERRQCSQANR